MASDVSRLFLTGCARAGTTALAAALSAHPDVYVTEPKEPHFAAFGPQGPQCTGPGDAATMNCEAVTSRTRWLETPTESRLWLDASTTTLSYSARATERIADHVDTPKFILIARDSLSRAVSAYNFLVARRFETAPFAEAVEREAERRAVGYQHLWWYTAAGEFGDLARPIVERFGSSSLLAIDYTELRSDSAGVQQACLRFAGAQHPEHRVDVPEVNGSLGTGFGARFVSRLAYGGTVGRRLRAVAPNSLKAAIRAGTSCSGGELSVDDVDHAIVEHFTQVNRVQLEVLRGLGIGVHGRCDW